MKKLLLSFLVIFLSIHFKGVYSQENPIVSTQAITYFDKNDNNFISIDDSISYLKFNLLQKKWLRRKLIFISDESFKYFKENYLPISSYKMNKLSIVTRGL